MSAGGAGERGEECILASKESTEGPYGFCRKTSNAMNTKSYLILFLHSRTCILDVCCTLPALPANLGKVDSLCSL